MLKKLITALNENNINNIINCVSNVVDSLTFHDVLKEVKKLEKNNKVIEAAVIKILIYNYLIDYHGHLEYYDYGFCNGGLKYLDPDPETFNFHNSLLSSYFEVLEPLGIEVFKKLSNILLDFRVEIDDRKTISDTCFACLGVGTTTIYDGDGDYVDEDCLECSGTGELEVENLEYENIRNWEELDDLDKRYMEIKKELIEEALKLYNK